jgi:hypothetical protein
LRIFRVDIKLTEYGDKTHRNDGSRLRKSSRFWLEDQLQR